MADGMFDGGGGSGGGSFFGGVLVQLPWYIALPLIVIVLGVTYAMTQHERELDHTVYADAARANFDEWVAAYGYTAREGTLWFEDGTSRRGAYHCKGGEFRTDAGEVVTFCCGVAADASPACVTVQ